MMASFIKGPNYVRSIRPSPWIDSILLRRLFFWFSGCNCLFGGFFLFLLFFLVECLDAFSNGNAGCNLSSGNTGSIITPRYSTTTWTHSFICLNDRAYIYSGMGWSSLQWSKLDLIDCITDPHTWPSTHGSGQLIWVPTIQKHAALEIEHQTYQYAVPCILAHWAT